MPHCIIEYATTLEQQVDANTLTKTVFETVAESLLFERQNVRARAQGFSNFILGTEDKHFIHVTIRLFQGRSDKEKVLLNEQIGNALKDLQLRDVKISVECVDIHKASIYPKTI